MIVAVNEALAICGIKMRVLADESRAGAVEKRGVMEGFGELEEWGTRLEDDSPGVILSFWVRVDSELGWTVRALWVGCGRLIVGQKRWL
jgi:hypothetical protein